jgi:hypothetical protein
VNRRWIIAAPAALLVSLAPAPARAQAQASTEEQLAKQVEAQQADLEEQAGRIRQLEKKLAEILKEREAEKAAAASAPPPPPPPPPPPAAAPSPLLHPETLLPEFFRNLTISGYVQGQYENHQDSQDQLSPSGAPLNQDRFVLRRARLKIEREWQYASAMFEVDGNTVNGPSFGVLHAEASALYRGDRAYALPPYLKLTFGLFDTPFGYELVESPKTRWFMERSLASRSLFPGEPDVGARLTSALGWFRGSVAVLNGNPLGEATGFPLRSPAATKDIVARAGAELEPAPWLSLAGGASIYNGKGFHPGTAATKNAIQWVDTNGDGLIEPNELVTVPASTATPSQTFDRWAVGGDLRAEIRSAIGATRLSFEVVVANNMDRGLFIADPVLTGIDSREIGFTVGGTQEICGYGVAGFRFDSYDPNGDAQDRQGGKLVPTSQTVRTFSPLVGLAYHDRARLLFQYDVVRNHLGRDARGFPTNLRDDTWTLRLQGSL